MKRSLTLLAATTLISAGMAVLSPPAGAAIGAGCRVTEFIAPPGSVTTYNKAAKITHGRQYTLPPNSTYSRTWIADYQTSITGSFTWESGGEIGAGGISKIISSVKGHYNVTIQGQGVRTSTSQQSQTLTVKNTSNANKTYVFFAGTTRYYGQYRQQYCRPNSPGGNVGSVQWKYGKYSSWSVLGSGGVMCGAYTTAALPKAAQAWGCG